MPFVREGLLEKKLTDLKEGSANFLLFVEVRACSYPVPESARPPVRPPARSGRCTSLWSSRAFSTVALPCAQVELYHGNELMCAALSTDPVPFRYGCAAMPLLAATSRTAVHSLALGRERIPQLAPPASIRLANIVVWVLYTGTRRSGRCGSTR